MPQYTQTIKGTYNNKIDVECVYADQFCTLCQLKNTDDLSLETNNLIVKAYVERPLVQEAFSILSGKDNSQSEDDREWVMRLLRWILGPVCFVSAPEISLVANTESQTLDIYNSCGIFNPKETMPRFRLYL